MILAVFVCIFFPDAAGAQQDALENQNLPSAQTGQSKTETQQKTGPVNLLDIVRKKPALTVKPLTVKPLTIPQAANGDKDQSALPALLGERDEKLDSAAVVATMLGREEERLGREKIWLGAKEEIIVDLLNRLSPHPDYRSWNSLMIGLLLTGADKTSQLSTRFTKARIQALMRFGWIDQAVFLARRAVLDESQAREAYIADAMLLQGDRDFACELAGESGAFDDPAWAKIRTFCEIWNGNRNFAILERNLLSEFDDNDALFFSLVEQALSDNFTPDLTIDPSITPIHLSAASKANIALAYDGDKAPLSYFNVLRASGSYQDKGLLFSRAWNAGILSPKELIATFQTPSPPQSPLQERLQIVTKATDAKELHQALQWFVDNDMAAGIQNLAAGLAYHGPNIFIAPDPIMAEMRNFMIIFTLRHGARQTRSWFLIPPSLTMLEQEPYMRGILRLADAQFPVAPGLLQILDQNLEISHPLGLLLRVFDDPQYQPEPNDTNLALLDAANRGQKAETILRALLLVSQSTSDPDWAGAIYALDKIGFGRQARKIALEYVLRPIPIDVQEIPPLP